jgi:hypothetical protein
VRATATARFIVRARESLSRARGRGSGMRLSRNKIMLTQFIYFLLHAWHRLTTGARVRLARQSGIHSSPYSTVTVLVTFVSVQTPAELVQRVKLHATHAHFGARVGLHNFVERTVPPLGYCLGPGDSDAKARGHWVASVEEESEPVKVGWLSRTFWKSPNKSRS